MIIERKLFREIAKRFNSQQAIVVTGMRRVGKTTLLRFFYERVKSKNKLFLDLEDPLNRTVFSQESFADTQAALEARGFSFSEKGYLFLDEIQFLPNVPSLVKYFYDHNQIKFFLTGSASFYLKNLFSESLAGRKYLFELYPLDFEEFLWFKKINHQLPDFKENASRNVHLFFAPLVKEYLKWGGMPEIVLLKNPREKEMALKDIFSSYFQKEVQTLGDFRKNEVVQNLILLLAKRTGQKLDVQRISQELGVSRQTIYEYLGFLSGTYLISLVPAFGETDVAQRKQKKVYFIDPGFFSILEMPAAGSLFENAVFNNLRSCGKIYYFRQDSREIDFIAKLSPKNKLGIEVKETAVLADIKKTVRISQKLKLSKTCLVAENFSSLKGVKYLFQLPTLKPRPRP